MKVSDLNLQVTTPLPFSSTSTELATPELLGEHLTDELRVKKETIDVGLVAVKTDELKQQDTMKIQYVYPSERSGILQTTPKTMSEN